MLKEGDKAPVGVAVYDQNEHEITLGSFLANASHVVVYFYPKDNTPGCTKEACSFRDFNDEIRKLGVAVVGVSADSVASHRKFIGKYNLSFPLLSDPERKLIGAFGVWGKKKFMGKESEGTLRTTFLVSKDGTVMRVWENVKPETHAFEVHEYLKGLLKK